MMPTFFNANDGVNNPTDQVPPPFDGSPNSPTPSESGFELVEEEGKQKQQQPGGEADNQQKMDKIIQSVEKLRVAIGEEAEQQMAELDQKVADYQKNAQPIDTFHAFAPKRMELAKKLESKGVLYVRHHQQLKNALCGQKKSGKNGPTENFVLFSNKPNSTPDTLKQFFLALHYLFKLAEARKNCLFVDLELFSDGHKKTQMPKVISNSLDVFPLIGARLIKICGDHLVTVDWVAKQTQMLGVCTARTSDHEKIPSPTADQLLWPCHLPCPCAKKFGGKCPNGDHFWGCDQCGQTFKFAKQKNEDMGQKAPISHLFCDCGGTRVDRLTFRCAFFADHGDKFNGFTSVNLLNRKLERQSKKGTVNLLLEGKTGNGKSTLINAMHFYAQYDTFDDALRLVKLADFNSDSFAPASYSKSMLQNGKLVKIEAKLGNIGRKSGESQTQISAAYVIPPAAEDGQLCLVIDTPGICDTRGIEMDTQNTANTFGFFRGFDVVHGVGTVFKDNDNRADESFKYCVNDGILSNVHKNGAPNIVFLITHSSGLGNAIGVVGELLQEIEEENGVKIPLEDNVFSFDNAPFEALCLIKMKGVTYNGKQMRNFSEQWDESVQEFKRLMKHLATVKPHLTRETLSVYAARCAIADIMPIIASNGAQIQNNIVNREIEELNKTIGEDKKKAEIKFDKVVTVELKEPLMVCTSEKCKETVKTLDGDFLVPKRKDCAFDYSIGDGVVDSAIVTGGMAGGAASGAAGGALVGAFAGPVGAGIGALVGGSMGAIAGSVAGTVAVAKRWDEKECKKCGCCRRKHKSILTEQVVKRNVEVDPAVLERIKEKYKKLSMKEAFKQQMIEERDFCYKEPVKWISFLKSSAVKTFDDEMLKYIEQSIRDAEGKMAKLVGQFREEQQKSIEALRKFKEFYIKERTLFETASNNAEAFKFPTENIEQIFDELFALEITGAQMKANYEVVKKAKRDHQKQFTAEEERRAAKQNLVKAKPTKCQSASNQKAIQCYLDEMIENGQQQLGKGWKAGENAEASSNVGVTGGGESEAEFGV
ncbi:hypothetical protein niasHT_017428 [Heterodera trifolii]|uniref:G domain-containing protein n=1 Tax=Heterodera trifolii TaxID=157864 RepID=A0ABD2LK16_9BILA